LTIHEYGGLVVPIIWPPTKIYTEGHFEQQKEEACFFNKKQKVASRASGMTDSCF
jgi:hypothetical protein